MYVLSAGLYEEDCFVMYFCDVSIRNDLHVNNLTNPPVSVLT